MLATAWLPWIQAVAGPLLASRPVPRRSGRPRARALVVLGAVAAAAALPASGGAGPAESLRARAQALEGREADLAARSRGALLEVYALDSALGRAQARVQALSA